MSEFNENIKPAVIQNDVVNEMSAEEFQRNLLNWFEERGVVSDLRAHLRRHMIDILKDTSLGRKVSQKQSPSPKTQVINLLIAEYLMKNRYHFSLSVFSTEVPFLSILPDYSVSLANAATQGPSNADNSASTPNFTEQNFWDILQTLGFGQDSIYSKKLHNFYFNKTDDPLLICIIHLLSIICNRMEFKNEFENSAATKNILQNGVEPWLKDIYNLLTHFDIPDEIIIQLHHHLKSVIDKEYIRISTEESTKFNFLQAQLQKDFKSRETEICKMINEMENTFYKEKQKLSGELLSEQEKLNRFKDGLVQKQREYEDKLEALNRKEDSLRQRETEILEQTEILKSRIKIMQNVYDSITEENARANMKQSEETNEHVTDEQQEKLQTEYEKLRREIQETRETIKKFHETMSEESINKEKDHQIECEEKLLKGLLERVQAENSQLRVLNTQQQIRLDELSVRNSMLMTDLENSQATINILTRSRRANTVTVPSILPPPLPQRSRSPRTGMNYSNGGGENLGFVPQPPSQPTFRNLIHNPPSRDSRRKVPRRLLIHSESSDDTQSPTDDILREARQRLRKLEEETETVDRSYREFKQRHSQQIKDNIAMHNPAISHYMTMPEHIRPMFQPRNNRDFYVTTIDSNTNIQNESNFVHRKYPIRNDYAIASTSKCTDNYIFNTTQYETSDNQQNTRNVSYVEEIQNTNQFSNNFKRNAEETEIQEDYRSSVHSAESSASAALQLQNLSISSIEISSDNPDLSDNKSPEKDL